MRDMIVSLCSRFSVSFFFLFPQSKGYLALGRAHLEILAFKGGQFYSVLGAGGWGGGCTGSQGALLAGIYTSPTLEGSLPAVLPFFHDHLHSSFLPSFLLSFIPSFLPSFLQLGIESHFPSFSALWSLGASASS